jgi:hypothetical protein
MSVVVLCSGVSGIVLCIGADGHVAIETDHQGHCRHAEHSDHHAEHACAASELTASGCGGHDCVDLTLASDGHLPLLGKGRAGISAGTYTGDMPTFSQQAPEGLAPQAVRSGLHHLGRGGFPAVPDAQRTAVLRI